MVTQISHHNVTNLSKCCWHIKVVFMKILPSIFNPVSMSSTACTCVRTTARTLSRMGPQAPWGHLVCPRPSQLPFPWSQKKRPGAMDQELLAANWFVITYMFYQPCPVPSLLCQLVWQKKHLSCDKYIYVRILGNCILRYSLARKRLVALLFWICGIPHLLGLYTNSHTQFLYIHTQYVKRTLFSISITYH